MEDPIQYVATLIELHLGLDRQGPGDTDLARDILRQLPPLPPKPRIADLGCGTGAGALLLADHFQSSVLAVDTSSAFIEELSVRARNAGLDPLIHPIEADMAALDWPRASIDLLWSEGAVYSLGFERALRLWRPLLADDGIAVVSEMSWFIDEVPEPARTFWEAAYPTIASEDENTARAGRTGFRVLATRRLPSSAWWANYYDPLRTRIAQVDPGDDRLLQTVIQNIEAEMELFQRCGNAYGYTFYVLRAI